MERGDRIRTPLKQRWRRFRYGVLPPLSFLACVALTLWLWQRQGQLPNAIGEVEVVRLPVAAGVDGKLLPISESQPPWELFDTIKNGQLIARLDDAVAWAEVDILKHDLTRLRLEAGAAQTQLKLDTLRVDHDQITEKTRLVWQVEQYRLDVLDRIALIESDRIELQRLEARLQFIKPAYEKGSLTEMEFLDNVAQRNVVEKRIQDNTAARDEARSQLERARQHLQKYAPLKIPELDAVLAPFEAEVATQESRIRHLKMQIASLYIRAPIAGTICEIFCRPGQYVQAGDPILTIATDEGRYAVTYLRQEQRIQPVPGMLVDVRPRIPGTRTEEVAVQRVGPQFEQIPLNHQRDPRVPEWGLPVRIALPKTFHPRPGEMIDIHFKKTFKKGAG